MAVASQPATGSPSVAPEDQEQRGSRRAAAPGSARRGRSDQPLISEMSSAVAVGLPAQDRHDDAEADDDLGGRDHEHEEDDGLAGDVVRVASANATKVRFTALSISSTHMNITSGLRRTRRPTVADA